MSEESLLITFVAILADLGLTDLIHRLLRKRLEIKWYWIPLAHTFISFQGMIIIW